MDSKKILVQTQVSSLQILRTQVAQHCSKRPDNVWGVGEVRHRRKRGLLISCYNLGEARDQ